MKHYRSETRATDLLILHPGHALVPTNEKTCMRFGRCMDGPGHPSVAMLADHELDRPGEHRVG